MPVGVMLASIPSYELSEWEAYERAFGPLGKSYTEQALAQIADTLAILLRLYGEQFEENPVPEPQQFPRPPQWFATEQHDDSVGQAEFDRDFRT